MIQSESYDFVLSSHTLEHSANPLRALGEWARVLKPGAALVLVVPHRDGTFDHRRPLTTLTHLINDLEAGTGEADLTHLPEILQLHDFSQDPGGQDVAAFRERAERNVEYRSLHHHVFDTRLAADAVRHAGLELTAIEALQPYHVVLVAQKPRDGAASARLSDASLEDALRKSPFQTDRRFP
jgi:SAM-dependent methyltransferase